jgi:hypothetical protein
MPMSKAKHTKKAKKNAWFIKTRGSYLPHSRAGWLTYIPYIAYLDFTAVVAYQNASSLSTGALIIVPNWVAATVILTWVAARKS